MVMEEVVLEDGEFIECNKIHAFDAIEVRIYKYFLKSMLEVSVFCSLPWSLCS